MPRGVLLEDLAWVEAESVLTPDAVVLIPLGAAAKEHGPHLRLNNDFVFVQYLRDRIIAESNVVAAPTVNYSYYPAFIEYPGSVCLEPETARGMIVDICRSLGAFGPKRFYVLNTGVSTLEVLREAAEQLAASGMLLTYTNLEKTWGAVVREVSEQEGGSHADEIETSVMLNIAPDRVDMSKAAKDFDKIGTGRLSRDQVEGLTYSPTGIWGDATLATVEKGARVVKSLLAGILADIEKLRGTPLPN